MKHNATLICDLQFGSTGKGACAGYLATKNRQDTVVTAWSPNAGHTFIDADGRKFVHCMLANGVVSPALRRIMIAPGSIIDTKRLKLELEWCADLVKGKTLIIHENAAVVQQKHRDQEEATMTGIGSTKKGSGAALIDKLMRQPDGCITVGDLRDQIQRFLSDTMLKKIKIVSTGEWLDHLEDSHDILVEGAQGFSLGINSGFHPYCLSYDTKVLMADGTMQKVGDLVTKKSTAEVMCMDDKGGMTARPIINWVKHDNLSEQFYMIRTATSEFAPHDKMWYGAKMTADHKIQTPDGVKRVDELEPGRDRVYTTIEEPRCTTEMVLEITTVKGLNRRGARSGKYSYCIEVDEHHNFFVGNGKGRINVENCTSRECTPAQIMSDTLISPERVRKIVGVMRTFPIRVANRYDENGVMIGYSGPGYPDQNEITWEEIGQKPEYTTVTKLKRRLFDFSLEQTRQALSICTPDEIYLSFCDYLPEKDAYKLKEDLNRMCKDVIGFGRYVKYMAFGPGIENVTEV